MIKVKNIETWGFKHAVRGMRNPLNSWDKSDSAMKIDFAIGKTDLHLMKRLFKAGAEQRKYLRQIFVSMDITAPLYWWKQFDTYKIGTVSNSCSTMHKIHAKPFAYEDFSWESLDETVPYNLPGIFIEYETGKEKKLPVNITLTMYNTLGVVIDALNEARNQYLKTKNPNWWKQMIVLLPESYNQKRTITMTYENVFNIIRQRTGHKLSEWNDFIRVVKSLPYIREIGGYDELS